MIKININYLQLLSGIQEPILESNKSLSYIGKNWITHLRDYLITINAKLEIKDLWQIKKQTTNDRILM